MSKKNIEKFQYLLWKQNYSLQFVLFCKITINLEWASLFFASILKNVIYNELRMRGYAVDVGVIETRPTVNGKAKYSLLEVNFVARDGNDKL